MIAALPLVTGTVVLAGGVDPEDASPGIGAFVTFLILALVIVLLAWSFTRHQRKIRANAAQRDEWLRQQAEQGPEQPLREQTSGGAAAAPGSGEANGQAASAGTPGETSAADGPATDGPTTPEAPHGYTDGGAPR